MTHRSILWPGCLATGIPAIALAVAGVWSLSATLAVCTLIFAYSDWRLACIHKRNVVNQETRP